MGELPFGCSLLPLQLVVVNALFLKAYPRVQTFRVPLRFPHLAQCLDAGAVQQTEVTRVLLNRHTRHALQQGVIPLRGLAFEPCLLTRATLGIHIVIPFFPPLEHLRYRRDRMLHVGIHDDDRVTLRIVETRHHRRLFAVVTRQVDIRPVLRIGVIQRQHLIQRTVGTAVIDEQKLPRIGRVVLQHLLHACLQVVKTGLFVVGGQQNGDCLFHIRALFELTNKGVIIDTVADIAWPRGVILRAE